MSSPSPPSPTSSSPESTRRELDDLLEALEAEKKLRRESDARLADLERRLGELMGAETPKEERAVRAATEDQALDRYYLAFEERFRGNRDLVKERLEVYGRQLMETAHDFPGGSCLDLGCGRGEWLEILSSHGLDAVGVDSNHAMMEACKARGLQVELGDGLEYLSRQADNSLALVSGFHIIEHLPGFETLVTLIAQSLRVLKSGGLAIFESPNPENLTVGACSFFLDHTHDKPLHPESVGMLLEAAGFVDVEVLRLVHARAPEPPFEAPPADAPMAQELEKVFRLLNNHLLSAPDFAVVGRKPRLQDEDLSEEK